MNTQIITLKEAAARFGVSQRKLYAELRARKILGSQNVALPAYTKGGFFQIQHRSHFRGDVEHQYAITLVTPLGYSLLQEVVDAMGSKGQVLQTERNGVPTERGAHAESNEICSVETDTKRSAALPTTRCAQN